MFCINAHIPKELNDIEDELKAIYHSKDSVCFFVFQSRKERNHFMDETRGMDKNQRAEVYENRIVGARSDIAVINIVNKVRDRWLV